MNESIQNLSNLFSTADAEGVEFTFDGADLILRFKDWQAISHELLFPDSVLVRWDDILKDNRFQFDSPHEIVNSVEIQKRKLDASQYRHYMLCFNATSNLEVISHQLIIRKPKEKKTQPTNPPYSSPRETQGSKR